MSPSWSKEVAAALAPKGRTLVITLGSTLRADDGVGPYVCAHVKFARPELRLLDAGTTPESVAQTAIDWKPDKIILIDAAHFQGAAGEVRVIPLEAINQSTVISTHSFPLSVTFSIVKEDTKAELVVIGVQAKSLDYKEGLSPEAEESASKLAAYFNKIGN
jgi:hydrogenase 3 maturation protease